MGHTPIPVSVNLLWCVPAKVGGSEDYLVRQLLGLAEIESDIAPTLYAPAGFGAAHPDLAMRFPVVEAPIDGSNRTRRVLAEHVWLANRTRGSLLVHHGGGTVPSRGTRPIVLTIHDLQYLTYPQYFSTIKRNYLRAAMPRSVSRADVITVPTEYVRASVIETFRVADERVIVVPHGMESTLGNDATDADTLRARYGLGDGPIIVLPAMTHPHKGHLFLLGMMASRWTDPSLRLVFTGGAGAAEAEVRGSTEQLGLGDRVVRTGRVPAADRDGLLRMAAAMVFPSEYEGFGAPVIEAMALGVPVICSDRACLPEVAGDAAIVLPLEPDAWSGALDRAVAERDHFVVAGRARAAQFTARLSGLALRDAYGRALR